MPHISIRDLTVEFAIFGSRALSLKNTLLARATGGRVMAGARSIVMVRALENLNLEINDGDRIGLVGHNGAGKTTLLRVLAGIYKPVGGSVTLQGRVRTLFESSAGIDHEATGLENIYLRGCILGMSRREIDARVDDIASFADLGDFLHLPMRTYSAGMSARLAFAISTTLHNDILLVDEGIGAGDHGFQEKAQQRIENLFTRASIIVIASHSEELIRRFCNRRVQLEQGRLVADSPVTTRTPVDRTPRANTPQQPPLETDPVQAGDAEMPRLAR